MPADSRGIYDGRFFLSLSLKGVRDLFLFLKFTICSVGAEHINRGKKTVNENKKKFF